MISEILPTLFIGDARDAESKKLIEHYNIDAILDLTGLHIDETLDDEAVEQVNQAVKELNRLLDDYKTVLVHCHAGIDRTPFVVALALHRRLDIPFRRAYNYVKIMRPQTIQHWEWVPHFVKEDK